MAEFNQSVTFKSKEVDKFLEKITSGTKDVEKANRKYTKFISIFTFQDIIDHFEKEEGFDGPWQKWSPSYAVIMKALGKSSNKILQDNGFLRQNLLPIENGGQVKTKRGQITWSNPAKTKKGFPYAAAHDEGGSQLPQRSFMWLSNSAMEKLSAATLKYIMEEA